MEQDVISLRLWEFARTDHPELVELLLTKGARLEARNNAGATALMEAAKHPCATAVKLLLERVNVNAADEEGHTALIFAAYHGRVENIKLLLASGPILLAVTTADAESRRKAVQRRRGRNWTAFPKRLRISY